MLYSVLDTLKGVAVFMLCCETILHLSPTKNYEKFVRPIIGFMLVIKMVTAFFLFRQEDLESQIKETIAQYENDIQSIYHEEPENITYDVTAQISEKLNEELINEYDIKRAELTSDGKNNVLRIYIDTKGNEISISPIRISDDSYDAELIKTIASVLSMNENNIEVIKNYENEK